MVAILDSVMHIHCIILSVLILITIPYGICYQNLQYYVKPSSTDYEDKCLKEPCKMLKEYQEIQNFSEHSYKDNNIIRITVIFLAGVHEARSDNALHFSNVEEISFIGHGHSDQVTVNNLDLRIITGTVLIL